MIFLFDSCGCRALLSKAGKILVKTPNLESKRRISIRNNRKRGFTLSGTEQSG